MCLSDWSTNRFTPVRPAGTALLTEEPIEQGRLAQALSTQHTGDGKIWVAA